MSDNLPTPMTEPWLRLRDNPILLAQARLHLRRKELVGQSTVMGLGSLLAILLGLTIGEEGIWNMIRGGVVLILGLSLLFRGANSAGAAIQADRTSGILDFHRATPTSPATDAAGYLLGSCAREYLLLVTLLPLLILSTFAADRPLLPTLALLPLLVLYGWLYQLWSMLMALVAGEKKRFINQVSLWVLVLHALVWPLYQVGLVAIAYLTPVPMMAALLEGEMQPDEPFSLAQPVSFLGVDLPPVVYATFVLGLSLSFVFRGLTRRLLREDMPLFSRPGALTFFGLTVLLVVGGALGIVQRLGLEGTSALERLGGLLATHLIGSTLLAIVLLLSLTPHRMELARATRRAQKQGKSSAPWREDGARVWPLVPAFAGLVLLGLLLALPELSSTGLERLFSSGMLVVLPAPLLFLGFMSAVLEYVYLGTRTSARSTLLVTFLSCMLPLLLAGILSSAKLANAALYVAALSPLVGFFGSAGVVGVVLGGDATVELSELTSLWLSQAVTLGITIWLYRSSSLNVPASAGALAAPASA